MRCTPAGYAANALSAASTLVALLSLTYSTSWIFPARWRRCSTPGKSRRASSTASSSKPRAKADEAAAKQGATRVEKAELFRQSDVISIHVKLSPRSTGLVSAADIALMKRDALLINTSRGPIVDEDALVAALRAGEIAGAGLDVFEGEPKVHPDLLTVPNVVLTPHIASATLPTRLAMANLAADNLIGFLVNGKPLTPLNPEVLG